MRRAKVLAISAALALAALVTTLYVGRIDAVEAKNVKTVIYFVRHAEDEVALTDSAGCLTEDCVSFTNPDGEADTCCLEVLGPVGHLRAELLAEWFRQERITGRITNVIATHKTRTLQTVARIASDAGLTNDVDQSPDGVQQVPPFVGECDAGFESAGASKVPMLDEISSLPPSSVAVVAGHSSTIYEIMELLGIDTTSDPEDFPRTSSNKVSGFGNVWVVTIDCSGEAELDEHIVLEFGLRES